MRDKGISIGLRATRSVFVVLLFVTGTAAAQQENVLYSFNANGTDGYFPQAGLIFDASGNLFGATSSGGDRDGGMVFELTPTAGGSWTETVLYDFFPNGADGNDPVAGVIFDASGNLYGTTLYGGVGYGCGSGCGTVFELTPIAGGGWTETVLHTFYNNHTDGVGPYAGLIFDASGNLYGTTTAGGTHHGGMVFELTPTVGSGWTETVLHNFRPNGVDGNGPVAGMIFDGSGNLYGTTSSGGVYNDGVVFELTPAAGGSWTEKVLHNFGGKDGAGPYSVIFDATGNLYGTTGRGGIYGYGTAFELTPAGSGRWTEKVLHSFNDNGTDGWYPQAGLVFDGSGNLYGTASQGGAYGYGTVFELTPAGGRNWTEKVLHSFNDNGTDGYAPLAGLTLDASGNLYGTTYGGGTNTYGAVFEITP
jgi:uncharacterized repeat protein (TIGR03803 family)